MLAFWTLASIILLSSIACVVNFLIQLRKRGWSGLNAWEKSVTYVAIAALSAPLLIDLFFWLEVRIFK